MPREPNVLGPVLPARTLRLSNAGLLEVTRSSHKRIGDVAFVNYRVLLLLLLVLLFLLI